MHRTDAWSEGYRAGMAGQTYTDNPYSGRRGDAAWAFGCGEGMRARNRSAFRQIIEELAEDLAARHARDVTPRGTA